MKKHIYKIKHKIHKLKKKWLILPIVILVTVSSVYLFEINYRDKFYPGVFIGTTHVGGRSLDEINKIFTHKAKILEEEGLSIKIIDEDKENLINIPISAQGLSSDKSFEYFTLGDWQKVVEEAYRFGRQGSLWVKIVNHLNLLITKKFKFSGSLYEPAARSLLEREVDVNLPQTKSAFFAINKSRKVIILPEVIGKSIEIESVINDLYKNINSLENNTYAYSTKLNTPKVDKTQLEKYLELAQQFSDKVNLYFHYANHKWKVTGTKFVTWLSIDQNNNLELDNEKLTAFLLDTVALAIDNPPTNSRFKIRDGRLEEISVGKSGVVVDIEKTAIKVKKIISDINSNLKSGIIDIPIEVLEEEPKITQATIEQYKIRDLVGTSKTSFKGSSADRINNITVGAKALNGFLIAPNQEFSAVDTIGYVTEEAGYKKEYVIKDNKSVKELGGGLCQIATTLFRMALDAGLSITERVSHRYVVGYYGPGLDATIYGPHPDLRFINDTGHYLLIQSRVEGTDLILELYGQDDGRQVEIGEPVITKRIPAPATKYVITKDLAPGVESCSETPRAGMTTDVPYKVAFVSGEVREQNFNSVYQPWQKICLIGAQK